MAKDFLDKLMEELAKLHEEKKVSGLAPDIARGKTIETFLRVVKEHELTFDEKKAIAEVLIAVDGITPEEAEVLRDLDAARKNEIPDIQPF